MTARFLTIHPVLPTGGCECGHDAEAHELVEGFDCSPGVTIDGASGMPDKFVCTGSREVADPSTASPWDYVCGCARLANTDRTQRLLREAQEQQPATEGDDRG